MSNNISNRSYDTLAPQSTQPNARANGNQPVETPKTGSGQLVNGNEALITTSSLTSDETPSTQGAADENGVAFPLNSRSQVSADVKETQLHEADIELALTLLDQVRDDLGPSSQFSASNALVGEINDRPAFF